MRKTSLLVILCLLFLLLPFGALGEDALRSYSDAKGYQYVTFGRYPAEKDGTVKPILWRVLKAENGEAWLLSEYILFAAPVHGEESAYTAWADSDLYRYLNERFIIDAFTPEEQSALLVRTEDGAKVTLITSEEMKDETIGFGANKARQAKGTAYAKKTPDHALFSTPTTWRKLFEYGNGTYSPWWSRTPSADYAHEQRRVIDEGKIGRCSAAGTDQGVRPTIYLDLKQIALQGGTGEQDHPYVLSSTAIPEPTQAPEPTAVPTEAPETDQSTVPDPDAEPSSVSAEPVTADPHFPALTAAGFLPEGQEEFVYIDEEAGLWLYASQSLRIEINRYSGTNFERNPIRWYEAHVFTQNGEHFSLYPYDKEHYASYGDRYKASVDKIAAQHHLVFATNSDFFIYRVERLYEERQKNKNNTYPIGVEIRDGQILYDLPRKPNTTTYPPLDVMAFYPDGTVSAHINATVTAEELIKAGATDAISFGPILVENGQVPDRAKEFGTIANYHIGFGIVKPGHYVTILVEARNDYSNGESCYWLGQRLQEAGCETAINLDGGGTTALLFMGKQINKSGRYGESTNRVQNELFGIGYSEAVQ